MTDNPTWTSKHFQSGVPSQTGRMEWARRISKQSLKKKFSVVEVKRAMNLLAGQGKTPSAVHVRPDGSFRIDIVPPDQAATNPDENPWDEELRHGETTSPFQIRPHLQ